LWRAGDADGGAVPNASYEVQLAGPGGTDVFDVCAYQFGCSLGVGDPAQPLSAVNRVVVPGANLGAHLYSAALCGGWSGFECPSGRGYPGGYAAVMYLYAADIVLEQSGGPSAREASGPLASEKIVQGTSDLVFNATDPGAGVWEALFSVDGRVVQSTVPNDFGGHCRNVGETTDGLPAFLYLQPCPQTESADVGFDTTTVGNGAHHLIVSVIDAAGNSATVLDREIDVENAVPTAPANPGPVVRHAATRRPRARVTLSIAPRKVSLRQSIHLKGRLLGGHVPKIGKLLVLQKRMGHGKWSGFAEIRTGRQGRFHGSYRFNFLGRGDYQLRVLSRAEPGYPFATGTSNVVRVRVV
jgi:hypothetical protein